MSGAARSEQQLPFPLRIPFAEQLGFELWRFGDGQAELRLDLAEQHLNSSRVAHGGLLMTLLDVAMAHAARSLDDMTGPGVVTIEMKTSFMRAADGRLSARGTLLHRTATMAFTEGSVFNGAAQLCAHATGTFKYMRAAPAPGRHAAPLPPAATTGDTP